MALGHALKRFIAHCLNRAGVAPQKGRVTKSTLASLVAVLLTGVEQATLLAGAWIPRSGPVHVLAGPVVAVLLAALLVYIIVWHEKGGGADRYVHHPLLRLFAKVLLPFHLAASLWVGVLGVLPAYSPGAWRIADDEARLAILNDLQDKYFEAWGIEEDTPWELYSCRVVLRDRKRAHFEQTVFVELQLERAAGKWLAWAGPRARDISWDWASMATENRRERRRWKFGGIPDSFTVRFYALVAWEDSGSKTPEAPLRRVFLGNLQ